MLKKSFWIVAILTFGGALLQNMISLTQNYISYPVSTTVTVVNSQQVVFPAVTICNMNPIKKSALTSLENGKNGAKKRRKRAGVRMFTNYNIFHYGRTDGRTDGRTCEWTD